MALKKKEKIDRNVKMTEIPLSKIQVNSEGLRLEEDPQLTESIKSCGLLNPLTVNERYELLAGGRRYVALKALGHEIVPVFVYRSNSESGHPESLHEELVQIDENLVRKNLTGAASDQALARRKKIYETIYPETKRGTAGAIASNKKRAKEIANDKSSVVTDSFVKDAAKKIGKSERSIERAVRRAEQASPKVQKAREQIGLRTSQVDELIKLSPDEQDHLLPAVVGKNVNEVKRLVASVGDNGLGMSIEEVAESVNAEKLYEDIRSLSKRMTSKLNQILEEQIRFIGSRRLAVQSLLENTSEKIIEVIALQFTSDSIKSEPVHLLRDGCGNRDDA